MIVTVAMMLFYWALQGQLSIPTFFRGRWFTLLIAFVSLCII